MEEIMNNDEIIEALQHLVDTIKKVWYEIKEVFIKIWNNFKIAILKYKKLLKYIQRYNKCKKICKKKHYMKKIIKILKGKII